MGDNVTVDLIAFPRRLSTDGEIVQVAFFGVPEQFRFTDPARPAIGVTVMVYVAWCPEEIVSDDGVALIEKSPTFT